MITGSPVLYIYIKCSLFSHNSDSNPLKHFNGRRSPRTRFSVLGLQDFLKQNIKPGNHNLRLVENIISLLWRTAPDYLRHNVTDLVCFFSPHFFRAFTWNRLRVLEVICCLKQCLCWMSFCQLPLIPCNSSSLLASPSQAYLSLHVSSAIPRNNEDFSHNSIQRIFRW